MTTNASANFPLLVSREQAGNTIANALRLHVGRGARYSVKQLSNATGVKDWMIEKALIDPASPDYRPLPPEALLSISRFLGAAFTADWLGLAQQGAFDLPDADDPSPIALAADCCDDTAKVTRAAIDGHFDDAEKPDLRVIGTRMVARGMRLTSIAQRAA